MRGRLTRHRQGDLSVIDDNRQLCLGTGEGEAQSSLAGEHGARGQAVENTVQRVIIEGFRRFD